MDFSWRFSGGIFFSLTLHTILIAVFVYSYPEITNKGEWLWREFPFFSSGKTRPSVTHFKNLEKKLNNISADKIVFPDLILIQKQKLYVSKTKKNSSQKPIYTINNILTQVENYPERIYDEISSNKQLSEPVVSLLSVLPNVNKQSEVKINSSFIGSNEQNNISSYDANELKNYLNKLSKFLSEGWEVPIHLKESKVKVAIIFEINKNGKILNWKLEKSGSPALHYSVNKLMKNLKFLPELPKSYTEDSYIFGVRFSPTISQK